MVIRFHRDKTMFYVYSIICFLCQPDPMSKYLWHANHPGFACSSLHTPSCSVISLTPCNTDAVGLYHLWHESKARSPVEQPRGKSSNWPSLASMRLLCCEHLYSEHKLMSSMSHSLPQDFNLKIKPALLQ